MRLIKKIHFVLLFVLFYTTLAAQSDSVLVPYDQELMEKGLEINLNLGNIEIIGTDRKDILVKYNFEKNSSTTVNKAEVDGLKRISISKASVEIESDEDLIRISSWDHNKFIHLHIEVPKNINISTFKGGPGVLSINNIIGNLNLENNSGSITATDITGIVNASTNEGDIKVTFNSFPENKTMMLINVIGDIEVNIPKGSRTSFHMKTKNGELLTNLDLEMIKNSSSREDSPSSDNGFSYSNNTWTDALLNGGGSEITFSSMTGNIIIKGF